MNVVLYARVSSDKQDVDLSITAQLRHLRAYAKSNGYHIVMEYVDEVKTGRTSRRSQFQQMVADAKRSSMRFEAILVWKYARFARNREDSIIFKSLLRKHGVRVISITEPFEDTPTGRLLEAIIESLDEFYSANLAQEIIRGMRESASRGFYMASRAPYGYKRVKVMDGAKERPTLEPDPKTSPVVKRMFNDFLKSRGLKQVVSDLNNDGIASPKGRQWNKSVVHKILVNRAYTGELVWGKQSKSVSSEPPIMVENAWESLVEKKEFDAVQTILRSRSFKTSHPRRSASRYLLSGLMKCANCKRSFSGKQAKSGRYSYYVCGSLTQKGAGTCSAPNLPTDQFDSQVVSVIKDQVLHEDHLRRLAQMVEEEMANDSSDRLKRQQVNEDEMEDVRHRLDRLYEALVRWCRLFVQQWSQV